MLRAVCSQVLSISTHGHDTSLDKILQCFTTFILRKWPLFFGGEISQYFPFLGPIHPYFSRAEMHPASIRQFQWILFTYLPLHHYSLSLSYINSLMKRKRKIIIRTQTTWGILSLKVTWSPTAWILNIIIIYIFFLHGSHFLLCLVLGSGLDEWKTERPVALESCQKNERTKCMKMFNWCAHIFFIFNFPNFISQRN